MEFKGTPGPWKVTDDVESNRHTASDTYHHIGAGKWFHDDFSNTGFGISGFMSIHDAKLIAAAPDLLNALNKAADYMWEDTRLVKFDSTMIFGSGYDFDGWEDFREELHAKIGSFAVWPTGHRKEYYAYGGMDGTFWNVGFKTKQDARNAVISHISKLEPEHPAVLAHQAINKALGRE